MRLTILHTNDLHGSMTDAKAEFIASLKAAEGGPVIYCDTGDCIKAGNLAIPIKTDPVWERLERAGCDLSVLGNRETHVLESAFERKIAGHRQPILCANLRRKNGARPLPDHVVLERGDVKIGVSAVMVPMVTERMATAPASAYLWDPPIPTATEQARALREKSDCLIMLTHIGFRQDRELAEKCPEIDVILGGHSHTVLEQPEQVGRVFICQGGSHGRFVGRYVWEKDQGLIEASLIPLP